MEPYKEYYPLSKEKNIFSKDIKENTIGSFSQELTITKEGR
jgi:hypothetical protein